MKVFLMFLCCCILAFAASGQQKDTRQQQPDSTKKIQVVEAACGECQLGLDGNSCDLAVRIEGKSWFVDGTDIDSHGDAHAKDGFCKTIRKAEVQGELVANRFKVTYFKLLNDPVPQRKKQ
jgi:Family of unknown function (DUF6370)